MPVLSVGAKLGPYEIIAPIGAGGMGEVYRAKDTKLEREVAIKVLPAALAQDPERLARFEREAKVLASLNHPNIAQIYGIEEANGVRALVMELVPGETLRGPLLTETALELREANRRRAGNRARKRNHSSRSETREYHDHAGGQWSRCSISDLPR